VLVLMSIYRVDAGTICYHVLAELCLPTNGGS
jgi:hypothetical protein